MRNFVRRLFNRYEDNEYGSKQNQRQMQHSTILGIESSCDDTAAAVWRNGKILANITAGQKVHEEFGGVVPELASRAHQSNIVPVVEMAIQKSGIQLNDIDAIAVTLGPGLVGSLLVGMNMAKGMAIALNKPLIGIDHLQAHIAALYIENPEPAFPLLTLLVSGGHTQLVLVHDFMHMQIVGNTIDDAAGEAFDKAAKLLNLGYPGGPLIDKAASTGDDKAFEFPDAKVPDLNMSFSGIKTSLLYFLRNHPEYATERLNDVCASYQYSIVRYLIKKAQSAVLQYKPASIGLVGGVSANSKLRAEFLKLGEKHQIPAMIPAFEYCTDNAAMIATAGSFLLKQNVQSPISVLPFSRHGR